MNDRKMVKLLLCSAALAPMSDHAIEADTTVPHLRVLVVDDEPLLRWSLAETLTDAGCAVTEATDCLSALSVVAGAPQPFDVVLLDCRLPDGKDLSLLARLRGCAASTAVVFMTAFGTPELVADALRLGAFRVISKPFEMRDIPPVVFAAARQSR